MNRMRKWISGLPFPFYKLVSYVFSLLLIGAACSVIYWPSGLLVVGGLIWLDLFVTDLIIQIRMERRSEDDVHSR